MSKPPVTITPAPAETPISRLWQISVVLMSLAAAAIAGYLFYTWWIASGGPLGCGRGSGCEEVLTSRWSKVLNLPVSLPALLVYLTMATLVISLDSRSGGSRGQWLGLAILATTVLAAAVWFVFVQLILLKSICPWCMADHVLGGTAAVLILIGVWKRISSGELSKMVAGPGIVIGLVLTGILIGFQFLIEPTGNTMVRRDDLSGEILGTGADRQLVMLDGELKVRVAELPTIGSVENEIKLLKMFDYCCPHCRAAHGFLIDIMEQYPGQFVLFKLPMPLNTSCNPHWDETEPRFLESCDLARLAIAVWLYHPEQFAEFDQWLFATEEPRKLADAVERASAKAPLAVEHRDDPRIEELLRASTEAFESAELELLPVIMSPNFSAIVGRPMSKQDLLDIFEAELDLSSGTSSDSTDAEQP